ncbi:hypothetical protein FM119_11010 [Mycetocola reblochoni REB411]|uniref:DUF58 domain-containing protein n=1 Tax=Mycetocola reblochoni REB411 TaxID=1255698 RepID=A0A1R4K2W6_9MICO|nr:hypothetical protein FM119_11010 [Mycetocola reblochoni REB411]
MRAGRRARGNDQGADASANGSPITRRTRHDEHTGGTGLTRGTEATRGTSRTLGTTTRLGVAGAGGAPRWLRRLRRRARRVLVWLRAALSWVSEVTTPVGWASVLGAVVLGVAGLVLGWAELLTVAAGLGVLVLASLLFLIGRPRYDVELEVDARRTRVGEPVAARVRITDRTRFRIWVTRIELGIGDRVVELPAPGPGGRTADVEVPAERRGVVTVGPVRTVRGDPVGLFRRHASWSEQQEVYVHPETVGLPPTSTGFVRDLEGSPTTELTTSDISFHALREYREGDERRHVYWKAVARTGQLMVRQFEQTRRSHIVVAFGRDTTGWADQDEFELGVSVAASLGVRAIRDGRDITVLTSPEPNPAAEDGLPMPVRFPTVSPTRLLDGLSEVEFDSAEIGVGELAVLAAATVPGISIVFLVTGTEPSVRELRSWSQRLPLGVQTIAVVCGPGMTPGFQQLAELSVLRIGYLDDLRLALLRGSAS